MFKIELVLMSIAEEVDVGLRNSGVEDWFTDETVNGVNTAEFMLLPTINDDPAVLLVVRLLCVCELEEASWLDVSTGMEGIPGVPVEDAVFKRLLWRGDAVRIF